MILNYKLKFINKQTFTQQIGSTPSESFSRVKFCLINFTGNIILPLCNTLIKKQNIRKYIYYLHVAIRIYQVNVKAT